MINFSISESSTALSDGTSIFSQVLAKMAERWPVCVAVGDINSINSLDALLMPCTAEKKSAAVWLMIPNFRKDELNAKDAGFYFSSDSQRPFKATLALMGDKYDACSVLTQYDIAADLDGKQMCITSSESDAQQEGYLYDANLAKLQPGDYITYTSKLENGRYAVIIETHNFDKDKEGMMALMIEGEEGQLIRGTGNQDINSILWPMNTETEAYMTADGLGAEWAMTPNVIAVGAYNTYKDSSFNGKLNYLTTFSSYMTHTPKGRMLPMVCAPGIVRAAYNKWYEDEYKDYLNPIAIEGSEDEVVALDGTSMASPYMAGVIALWLEANPGLTPAEVKDIIAKTARQDEYVKAESIQARWGYGKVDAYAGLKEALNRATTALTLVAQDKDFLWRKSGNQLEAYVAGETALTVCLIDMEGKVVAQTQQVGNTATLALPQGAKGVYVLHVQGRSTSHAAKVVMR